MQGWGVLLGGVFCYFFSGDIIFRRADERESNKTSFCPSSEDEMEVEGGGEGEGEEDPACLPALTEPSFSLHPMPQTSTLDT